MAQRVEGAVLFELDTDYFAVFDLPPTYSLDHNELKAQYLALQKQFHPDRFAGEPEAIQRLAIHRAAYLNQAYDTLKSPLKRAVYMVQCALQDCGDDFDPNTQIHNDPEFLMEQMELRERLAGIDGTCGSVNSIEALRQQADDNYLQSQRAFVQCYDSRNWRAAEGEINKMMFAVKLLAEIDEKEEACLG